MGSIRIPAELRSTALRALSQQATFRVVLLARTKEMATAAKQAFLDGAAEIELQGIDPSAAADYLKRVQLDPAQAGWRELADRVYSDPNGPLARALSHPGTLTLVRDTFRGDDVRELLAVSDAAGDGLTGATIEDLLLDRVLPAAYAPRPGDATPRYQLQSAHRALSYIASRMNQDGTADLAWWRVPAWTARAPQIAVFGLGLGAVFGVLAGIGAGRAFGLAFGIGAGLVFGIVVALVDAHRRGSRSPALMVSPRRRRVSIGSWLVGGLVFGLVFGLGGRLLFGPLHSVTVRLVGGLAFGLVFGLAAGLAQPGESTVSILGPRAFWQRSRARGLLTGLAFGLVGVLVGGLAFGVVGGLVAGLGTGVAVVLTLFPDTWLASVAFGQLALNRRTPVRLMLFLEDARGRGVLRNVGPVYQFRHPRMQDRLAHERTDRK